MIRNKNIKKIFGKNLKFYRKNRGFTQEAFAEKIGIETSNLSKIECGKSFPRIETIEKIVKVLDIEPYILYISEKNIDVESAYKDAVKKLDKLKEKPEIFKRVYDFICELSR